MQLDFDLAAPPATPAPAPTPSAEPPVEILSVRDLTAKIRGLLEAGIGEVRVIGEISNHRKHHSGHHYFTLKDESASIQCVLFAGAARSIRGIDLRDGMEVRIFGSLTVYENRGQYQIVVRTVEAGGEGALRTRFEELKRRLGAEGLFDAGRKRKLPLYPRAIGLVTSRGGAAVHDFLNVLWRRNPQIRVVLFPVAVQGRGAAGKIAEAIGALNRLSELGVRELDLLVVTRGGGSLEDLWEFNEEVVVRAVVASRLPVVSAIGHEIDFSLCDFASDLRAPTPSAAAELVAGEAQTVRDSISESARRMRGSCLQALQIARLHVRSAAQSGAFRLPLAEIDRRRMRIEDLAQTLERALHGRCTALAATLQNAEAVFRARHPYAALRALTSSLVELRRRAIAASRARMEAASGRITRAAALLQALSPDSTLARGYTITMDESGRPITSAASASPGQLLRTRFADGGVLSEVKEVEAAPKTS